METESTVKIALQVLAFNVDRSLHLMIENAKPYVDKIFIAYPELSWRHGSSRKSKNPTSYEEVAELADEHIEIIRDIWERDEDTRNSLLTAARNQDFDWIIIQDADEFYTDQSWEVLKTYLVSASAQNMSVINVPLYTFWKTPCFVIEETHHGIKAGEACFAINCRHGEIQFTFSRTTNAKSIHYIDEPCYHYSYVLSDQEVKKKIKTWAHSNDFLIRNLWYEIKWKRWHQSSKFLHPGSPWLWHRAIRFPLPQPPFARALLENISAQQQDIGVFWACLETIYDHLSWWRKIINGSKRLLIASLTKKTRQSH